jgi:holo-[acyl-carrier protein] synthase
MIIGVGIDIVEVRRVEFLLKKWGERFLARVFLPQEVAYCQGKKYAAEHFAARIAVKEAVLKAFGEGWTERIDWKDILVKRTRKGQPEIQLLGKGDKLRKKLKVGKVLVSISHAREYSVAQAILVSAVEK